jgi:SAM-dependent methyltransferase
MADTSARPSACRLCGGTQIRSLGPVADGDLFAGNVVSPPIAGGELWHCSRCESSFRHPILSLDSYARLYEAGASGQWCGDERRLDLQLIRSIIAECPTARDILDVGCGSGDFLAALPGNLVKCGIEPSVEAAAEASAKCIRIAAKSLELLPAEARFHVITLIDVIEHVPEPALLLEVAARHLRPGGIIVVSTGDPQSSACRVFQSRFWYVTFPEHVSFPSARFFELWQAQNGGGSVRRLATRYQRLRLAEAAVSALIQLSYFASPSLFQWVGRLAGRFGWLTPRRRFFSPAVPGLFVDHHVVTLSGPDAPERQNRKSA